MVDSTDLSRLVLDLRSDQRRRWSEGRPRKVEEYLTEHPALAASEEALLDLIYSEACLREELGETIAENEYYDRFPHLKASLAHIFEVHRAVQPGASDASNHKFPQTVSSTMNIATRAPEGEAPIMRSADDPLVRLGPGSRLGDYRLLELLGEGGMGQVFKAEHVRMHRQVALKVIPSGRINAPQALSRFQREIEVVARLKHPNVVTAYDAREEQGTSFLVMELVEGRDLAKWVRSDGPFPVEKAVHCTLQVARGLAYAHQHGIVHRDVKPLNIMLDEQGTVKILDLGLACFRKSKESEEVASLTGSEAMLGTIGFVAPEQASHPQDADARADVYSLGCTLHYLLTAQPLYSEATALATLLAHREKPIPSLREHKAEVPAALDAVFQKMVAKKPEERYQSMTAVIAALETCVGARGAIAASSGKEATVDLVSEDELYVLRADSSPSMATVAKGNPVGRIANPSTTTRRISNPSYGQILKSFFGRCPADETGRHRGRGAKLLAAVRKQKTLALAVAVGLLGLAGVIVLTVMIRVRHPDGKETVVHVPEGSDVAVGTEGQVDVTLPAGSPSPVGDGQGATAVGVASPRLSAGEGPGVRAIGPPPPPAVAPFDAKQAKAHQEAWSKYLGLPVEITNAIGTKFG
jgi:serine/threonine protein kinase